ncbi:MULTISPECIES: DUF7278 family profilin-like fold-containing protein [Enterococcus]|uniref:DUF7278 family profilin-like fold-containing protein n=1 Tax=Enterococcus TaxID=1350 RepID=UPI00065E1C59|nr:MULTISPECIES: hypothetical protein [Enterococcus]KAF1302478.1 hypothetical protein BAU16_06580 [Enterococcus sp. JM9B]
MDFFESLEWSNWKNLSDEVKNQMFRQVLMYFVSPLRKINEVKLVDFELAGIKCRTFEILIDNEHFVFVPGNQEAILGWDLGIQGLPTPAWNHPRPEKQSEKMNALIKRYQLETSEDWQAFVNHSTSDLRKAVIPPMLVQKFPLPAGTTYLGNLNTITGEFTGEVDRFEKMEEAIRATFIPPQSFEESLTWSLPKTDLKKDHYYLELGENSDDYYVFEHTSCTQEQLRKRVRRNGFDLLTEEQWEYAVGGGTRRLFRWGNDLDADDSYWGNQVKKHIKGENMFGLVFSPHLNRYEVTDGNKLKMEQWENSGIPLLDLLPFATYYRSSRELTVEEEISPTEFLYRKTILIKK